METKGTLQVGSVPCPESIDGILEAIRNILLKGKVHSIAVKMDEPITFQRELDPNETIAPEESTFSFSELKLSEIIRNVIMEEFDESEFDLTESPIFDRVIKMFNEVEVDTMYVTHLLIGERSNFFRSLKIPTKRLIHFLGATIVRDKDIPENVFILCVAETKGAAISEIIRAVKGNIYERDIKAKVN